MKIKKKDGKIERQILIAMLVSDAVVSRISRVWDTDLFVSDWASIVGSLCVKYFDKYGKAPKGAFETVFHKWAKAKNRDEDTVSLIEKFLVSLEDEFEEYEKEINADYIFDLASDYFNANRLKAKLEELQDDLDSQDVPKAIAQMGNFKSVELCGSDGIDLLRDTQALQKAFEAAQEPIIRFKDDLGRFFGSELSRDSFVGILAPEKRGKSFWLMELGWRAMMQRKKVAFFAIGDMSQAQMIRRFASRATGKPQKPKKYLYPLSIEHEGPYTQLAQLKYEKRQHTEKLNWQITLKSFNRMIKRTRTSDTLLKLATYPAGTLSVSGIEDKLAIWEREGDWVPDVIVIDYADILFEDPRRDKRTEVDKNWRDMRALSSNWHGLVLTATQANAKAYNAPLLGMGHFTESKSKNAHVTAMFAINQTVREKKLKYSRLNWIARREDDFDLKRCVYVAECRDIGRVAVLSTL